MNLTIERMLSGIGNFFKRTLRFIYHTVDDHPLSYFFCFMSVVMALIILTFFIQNPKAKTVPEQRVTKEVEVFSIGKAPQITMQGKVEKSGVIKISALTGGVVQNIYKHEGEIVVNGTWLFGL